MTETTIELRKQSFVNGDVIIGAILCGAIFVGAFVQFGSGLFFYFLLAVGVLLLFAWRKFARRITVDFSARSIRSVGMVSLFRQSFSFDDLECVRCPTTMSLDAVTSFNVVFRRQGAIQPLIFEARSEAERTQARQLLAALRITMPNKVRDDDLS